MKNQVNPGSNRTLPMIGTFNKKRDANKISTAWPFDFESQSSISIMAPPHKVRRNNSVAAASASAAKINRKSRSPLTAINPVFFKTSCLNPCTA